MKIFIDFAGKHLVFSDPKQVFISHDYLSIKSFLDQIEAFTQQGYYAVGYLAYESAMGFNSFNRTKQTDNQNLPLLLFGIFDAFFEVESFDSSVSSDIYQPFDLISDTTPDEYYQKITYIKSQIEAGNSYQTNYTIQFTAPFDHDPIDYYRFLQKNNQANYCAYLQFDGYHILSISPELFFELNNGIITTKPMKGTAARGLNSEQDTKQLASLFSEKNQAENMMIVDLLRNDLSQISQIGTVTVPKLFEAEKYPTVWQLTSTIQSKLKESISLYQIFQALFPCGSITGAPKSSTMNIIADLEKSKRGVYCGTIGYIEPFFKKAMFNIPIRTLTIHKGQMRYGVGGGVTWDSTSQDEYNEILAKTAILNGSRQVPEYLIESLLLENGQLFLLDEHLARLQDSSNYFNFQCDIEVIKQRLITLAQSYHEGIYKIRVLQYVKRYEIEHIAISSSMIIRDLVLAPRSVQRQNVDLYHKTSNRKHFPILTEGKEYINFNEVGEITEFVYGNIALLINDQWVTPKVESGLLAGTMRRFYLDQHKLVEKTVRIEELQFVEKIAFINSVRKWLIIDDEVLQKLKKSITSINS